MTTRQNGHKEARETQETQAADLATSVPSCGNRIGREESQNPQETQAASLAQSTSSCRDIFLLCDRIRETAFEVHKWFRHGHLEKVYENALANRLRKQGIEVRQQFSLPVYDEDGTQVGDYFADLLVEERLVVELKACKALLEEHYAQLLGYLRASGIEHGLLLNFGAPRLQVKKLVFSREVPRKPHLGIPSAERDHRRGNL